MCVARLAWTRAVGVFSWHPFHFLKVPSSPAHSRARDWHHHDSLPGNCQKSRVPRAPPVPCWASHMAGYPQKPEVPRNNGFSTIQWWSQVMAEAPRARLGS